MSPIPGSQTRPRCRFAVWAALVLAVAVLTYQPQEAEALIVGGEGNEPIRDPGWPPGAAAVFNAKARVAWWEGPPFGGGEWHAECRGNAAILNVVLRDFARIDGPKRLVLHDGVGHSFWLDPNRENKADADIDWVFVVWQPDRWKQLRALPADLRPQGEGDEGPVPRIDVYTGGRVRWSDVKVPEGIEVVDRRLEAHGFSVADGTVLEGTVIDLATGAPLSARMRLDRIEPQREGGYRYDTVESVEADETGRWVLKSAPAGWHRIVIESDGYVPRIAGYGTFDSQPRWTEYETGLSEPAPVAGRVTDDSGRPLGGVQVRLRNVVAEPGGRYESPEEFTSETDAEGRFRFEQVPKGRASVGVHKHGYCRPGLGLDIETPAEDVSLEMIEAATLTVRVDFTDAQRPDNYIVQAIPPDGEAVGRWSGSGNINAAGSIRFENVPPGNYRVTGRPNPGRDDEETAPVSVELRSGEATEVTLEPK